MLEIPLDIDQDYKHNVLQNEHAFFDGSHSRCTDFKACVLQYMLKHQNRKFANYGKERVDLLKKSTKLDDDIEALKKGVTIYINCSYTSVPEHSNLEEWDKFQNWLKFVSYIRMCTAPPQEKVDVRPLLKDLTFLIQYANVKQ